VVDQPSSENKKDKANDDPSIVAPEEQTKSKQTTDYAYRAPLNTFPSFAAFIQDLIPVLLLPQVFALRNGVRHVRGALDKNANLLMAVATIVIAVFTVRLWITSNRQWFTMQTQLELQERPWIAMEISLITVLTFTGKDGSMFVHVSLKNIGSSVAKNIHPFCKLGALHYGHDTIVAFENRACDTLGNQSEEDPHFGVLLFPNETHEDGEGVSVPQKDIADAIDENSER
jgi:hypothetical protein